MNVFCSGSKVLGFLSEQKTSSSASSTDFFYSYVMTEICHLETSYGNETKANADEGGFMGNGRHNSMTSFAVR